MSHDSDITERGFDGDRPCLRKGGFGQSNIPCWQLRHCIQEVRDICPAYLDQSQPCWRTEGTPCRELLQVEHLLNLRGLQAVQEEPPELSILPAT